MPAQQPVEKIQYYEGLISGWLARHTFKDHLVLVPNCTWLPRTGEVDLLVVTRALKLIDVEIKCTRADMRADIRKKKWWCQPGSYPAPYPYIGPRAPEPWPSKVWKHYYAMPEEIWRDDLMPAVNKTSGVILVRGKMRHGSEPGLESIRIVRNAKTNPNATVIGHDEVIAIARLASLRMWDAFLGLRQLQDRELNAARSPVNVAADAGLESISAREITPHTVLSSAVVEASSTDSSLG